MIALTSLRLKCLAMLALPAALGACAMAPPPNQLGEISDETRAMYAATVDNGFEVPAIEDKYLTEFRKRQLVPYHAPYEAGTIVVDPGGRFLYHLKGGETAMRYLIAVGAQGYGFSGEATIPFQRDWPYWTPTANMLRRDPEEYGPVRNGLPGGLENPLGARALYLYKNGRDTLYRIHGTPSPWTVGHGTSSGCIRMFNQDVIHLAEQVENGTKVVVLTKEEAGKWTDGSEVPALVAMAGADATGPDGSEG